MLELKKNNTTVELRNLQEQVQKNKEDIAKHYEIDRVLANAGMRIVGILQIPEELPDPLSYDGEYGDTYAIGYNAPYDYYIFTAPNANAGYPEKHWLNIGPISMEGAQGVPGPRGETGPQGIPGTKWRNGTTVPSKLATDMEGDYYLNTSTGDIYKFSNSSWSIIANIRGPQGIRGLQGIQGPQGEVGPQGPQGEKGDSAGYITIAGILENSSQLPSPTDINNLSLAYLIGNDNPYDLYIQIGENSDNAIWQNVGPFNIGTAVTVNGEFQSNWDSDSKLNKIRPEGNYRQHYFVYTQSSEFYQTNPNPIPTYIQKDAGHPYVGDIIRWQSQEGGGVNNTEVSGDGYLFVKGPIYDYHVANKKYVDDTISDSIANIDIPIPTGIFVEKETTVIPANAGNKAVYSFRWDEDGNPVEGTTLIKDEPFMGCITAYTINGTLQTYNPINNLDCVNKQYADGKYLAKITTTTSMNQVYTKAANGSQTVLNVLPSPSSGTSGVINKEYADNYLINKAGSAGYNRLYGANTDGSTVMFNAVYPSYDYSASGSSNRNGVAIYTNGQLGCSTPTTDYHTANKKYVDDAVANNSGGTVELYSYTLGISTTSNNTGALSFLSPLIPNILTAITSNNINAAIRDFLISKGYTSSNNVLPCSGGVTVSTVIYPVVGLYCDADFGAIYLNYKKTDTTANMSLKEGTTTFKIAFTKLI